MPIETPWYVLAFKFIAYFFTAVSIAKSLVNSSRNKDASSDIGIMLNTSTADTRRRLIYGPMRVGGNIEYEASSGSDSEYYHMILVLGQGPLEGIYRQDGTIFTTTGTGLPGGSNPCLIYLDGELWTDTAMFENCYFEFFNGSDDQNVCATLNSAIPEWTDTYRDVAYIYCRFIYNSSKFSGVPTVTVKAAGLQCYDPTADTIAYTENFALHAYDYMTRDSEVGGLGVDNWMAAPPASPLINTASVEAARAYCAAAGWTGGLVIKDDQDFCDNMVLILNNFRGDIVFSEGQYKFMFKDLAYETVAMDLVESDVLVNGATTSLTLRPLVKHQNQPNVVQATYYSEDLLYQEQTYDFIDDDALAAAGNRRETRIDLLGLNTLDKVMVMCAYVLERNRWGHSGSFTGRQSLALLDPGDLVTLTHNMPQYEQQYLRVEDAQINGPTVNITFKEEALALYDHTYNPNALERYVPPMIDPSAEPASVTNVTLTEVVHPTRLRSSTRLLIEFDPPANDFLWDRARIWIRVGSSGNWQERPAVTSDYMVDPVQEGVEYFVRLQSISRFNVEQDFDNSPTFSREIGGMNADPSNVSGFNVSASGSVVHITADPITDDDVIGYEIRMGSTWQASTFVIMLLDQPSARISGIAPGYQTFWIAAKNNAGNYSTTPAYQTVFIPYPTNFDYKSEWIWDYDAIGTHDNTEHTTRDFGDGDGVVDALKCSHTGGELGGSWTSPTVDMGEIKRARIYGDWVSAFVEGDQTWTSLLTPGDPFTSKFPVDVSWNYIWSVLYASSFSVTLQYGDAAVDENEFTDFATSYFEGDCRFYRIVINVTDPEESANIFIKQVAMTELTYV